MIESLLADWKTTQRPRLTLTNRERLVFSPSYLIRRNCYKLSVAILPAQTSCHVSVSDLATHLRFARKRELEQHGVALRSYTVMSLHILPQACAFPRASEQTRTQYGHRHTPKRHVRAPTPSHLTKTELWRGRACNREQRPIARGEGRVHCS